MEKISFIEQKNRHSREIEAQCVKQIPSVALALFCGRKITGGL